MGDSPQCPVVDVTNRTLLHAAQLFYEYPYSVMLDGVRKVC